MNEEHRYSLTRVCLRRGELSLPRSLTGIFAKDSPVAVTDTVTGTTFELELEGDRVLRGMGHFFAEHELDVNDTILIRNTADGVSFTAQKRESKPDYSSAHARQRVVGTILDAGPVTEAEARALLPGLPADFDLSALLRNSGKFRLKAGRWHDASTLVNKEYERQVDEALAQATQVAAPDTVAGSRSPQADEGPGRIFTGLGFQAAGLGEGFWLLEAGKAGQVPYYRAVVHALQPGVRLDWAALLERRRQESADYLAVSGPESELRQLKAPAELAQATLWSDAALSRLQEIALNLPLGPVDLEGHFRHDGLFGNGLERFERTVQQRIAERGAFSTVLANLAVHEGPATFTLEDASRGVDREAAARILDQLSRSPFQLVTRRDGGDWHLRQNVRVALQQLAEYATSLQDHMPRTGQRQVQRA